MKNGLQFCCTLCIVLLSACIPSPPPTPTPAPTTTPLPPTATLEPDWEEVNADLATDPSWTSDEVRQGFDIQVTDGTLIVVASNDLYANPIDTTGPHLEASGDFGITFVMEAATAEFAGISLYGTFARGSDWWQGITRLDVGIKAGKIAVGFWGGDSPAPSIWQEFPATGVYANKPVTIGLRKMGESLIVTVKGQEIGRLPDPGLITGNSVYFGLNVAPQNRLVLYSLTIEANHGQGVEILK
jgi:hypothetical protein